MDNKKNNMNDSDDKNKRVRRPQKRKICNFCAEKNDSIDYKDAAKLKRFITIKGKILPRRTSGVCAKHQRELSNAIKKARIMALLPFKAE